MGLRPVALETQAETAFTEPGQIPCTQGPGPTVSADFCSLGQVASLQLRVRLLSQQPVLRGLLCLAPVTPRGRAGPIVPIWGTLRLFLCSLSSPGFHVLSFYDHSLGSEAS